MGIRVFVSHAAKDAALAIAFVQWLEGCLVVPPGTVRCTSAPGYKSRIGDSTADALRTDLTSCSVVLGLITSASLESAYVLMELGAGWALNKRVACLLLPGVPFDKLRGPIAGNHATHLDQKPDLADLIDTLANDAGLEKKSDSQRTAATETFVKALPAPSP
jgi:hypothetical protein